MIAHRKKFTFYTSSLTEFLRVIVLYASIKDRYRVA